jgi:hypothetical protein
MVLRLRILFLSAALLAPRPARSQDVACTYARCALRMEQGAFRTRIVAGDQAAVVTKVTGFGTDLEKKLDLPDSAVFHVRRANSRAATGTILSILGLAATAYATFMDGGHPSARVVAFGAGAGLAVASGIAVSRSRNELNQTLWWYNRQFAR